MNDLSYAPLLQPSSEHDERSPAAKRILSSPFCRADDASMLRLPPALYRDEGETDQSTSVMDGGLCTTPPPSRSRIYEAAELLIWSAR